MLCWVRFFPFLFFAFAIVLDGYKNEVKLKVRNKKTAHDPLTLISYHATDSWYKVPVNVSPWLVGTWFVHQFNWKTRLVVVYTFILKPMSHISQMKGLSSVWILQWRWKLDTSLKDLLQSLHAKSFPSLPPAIRSMVIEVNIEGWKGGGDINDKFKRFLHWNIQKNAKVFRLV